MTEKSKVIPIRFSLAELETIENFIKKYEMKSMSDFVRAGSSLFIAMMTGIEKLLASGNLELIESWQNSMRNVLLKNKKEFKKFSQAFQLTEKVIFPRVKRDLSEGAKAVKPFTKERKAGRPKKPKRTRGKPTNLGYEK